ncbi:MAG: hypothetical protein WBY94_10565 [Polyangiaceae bacterium]
MRGIAGVLVCLAATAAGARARAQETTAPSPTPPTEPEYTLSDHTLRITRVGSSTAVDIGCGGRAMLRAGNKLFVACGAAGVVEFDLSDPAAPRRDGSMLVDGSATGLFLHDGFVWVEVAHVDARPVHIGSSSEAPLQAISPLVPYGERVAEAAPEAPPKEPESVVAPPRHGGLWELSLTSSAFVAFGSLGVGVLGSASVAYRFEAPFVLRAEVSPFGVGGPSSTTSCCANGQITSTSGSAVSVFAAHVLAGLDTQFVEVGLGVGGASVNENTNSAGAPATGSLTIVQSARIGAHDGLALNFQSSAIAINNQFNLGYFTMSLQIPVSAKAMLIARGGGGNVGFGYGDLGVRVLVRGNGGKGTLALTGYAGVDLIQENLCSTNPDPPFSNSCNTATLVGPALGGAVEWRL